jgi:hypothetical protein
MSGVNKIDPILVIYIIGGIFMVIAAFVIFSLFTEGVKAANDAITGNDKKKKEEEKKRRAA